MKKLSVVWCIVTAILVVLFNRFYTDTDVMSVGTVIGLMALFIAYIIVYFMQKK